MLPKNVPALVLVCLLPIGGASAGCYDSANGVQHRFVLNGGDAFDRKTGLTWLAVRLVKAKR
jgi:hypothetical protein